MSNMKNLLDYARKEGFHASLIDNDAKIMIATNREQIAGHEVLTGHNFIILPYRNNWIILWPPVGPIAIFNTNKKTIGLITRLFHKKNNNIKQMQAIISELYQKGIISYFQIQQVEFRLNKTLYQIMDPDEQARLYHQSVDEDVLSTIELNTGANRSKLYIYDNYKKNANVISLLNKLLDYI